MNATETKVLAWRAGQIPAQLEQALLDAVDQETGEIINDEAMAKVGALAQAKTVALTDLALFVKQAKTVGIAHFDQVIREVQAKKLKLQKAADICSAVIEGLLPVGETLETDFVTVSWAKTPAAVDFDGAPEILPEEFQRVIPAKVEPNKKAMAEALKAGKEIPSAKLVQRHVLRIK